MERGGAMATGDTGPGATTTARGRLRLVTMVIMEERTGAMATGPGATTTARGRLAMVTVTDTGMDTGAMAMATVSTTDKSDENCQSSIEFR